MSEPVRTSSLMHTCTTGHVWWCGGVWEDGAAICCNQHVSHDLASLPSIDTPNQMHLVLYRHPNVNGDGVSMTNLK